MITAPQCSASSTAALTPSRAKPQVVPAQANDNVGLAGRTARGPQGPERRLHMCVQVHACRCSGLCVCSIQVQESTAWVCRSSVLCVCVCVCGTGVHVKCTACVWHGRAGPVHCGGGHLWVSCACPVCAEQWALSTGSGGTSCKHMPGPAGAEMPGAPPPAPLGAPPLPARGQRGLGAREKALPPPSAHLVPPQLLRPIWLQLFSLLCMQSPEGPDECPVPRGRHLLSGTQSWAGHRQPQASQSFQATGPGGGTSQTPRCPGRLRGMAPPQPQVGGQGPQRPLRLPLGCRWSPS